MSVHLLNLLDWFRTRFLKDIHTYMLTLYKYKVGLKSVETVALIVLNFEI